MEKYGCTPQCPGCVNLRLGKYHRAHTEECRARIEKALNEDAEYSHRLTAAHARQDAWRQQELQKRLGEMPPRDDEQVSGTESAQDLIPVTPPLTPEEDINDRERQAFGESDIELEDGPPIASEVIDLIGNAAGVVTWDK